MKQSKTTLGKTNKTKPVNTKFKTVDEYISALPSKTKNILKAVRKTIKQILPQGEEVISYNIPSVKLGGKGVIWYAAWKEHISLYPCSTEMVAAIKELADHALSKGTIKFTVDQPIPLGLISKIIKYRVRENFKRTKAV